MKAGICIPGRSGFSAPPTAEAALVPGCVSGKWNCKSWPMKPAFASPFATFRHRIFSPDAVGQVARRRHLAVAVGWVRYNPHPAYRPAGGHDKATARWPYAGGSDEQERFAAKFMLEEFNKTKAEDSGAKSRYKKLRPEICNVQLLWKILPPPSRAGASQTLASPSCRRSATSIACRWACISARRIATTSNPTTSIATCGQRRARHSRPCASPPLRSTPIFLIRSPAEVAGSVSLSQTIPSRDQDWLRVSRDHRRYAGTADLPLSSNAANIPSRPRLPAR